MAYVRTRLGRWFYEEHGTSGAAGQPPVVFLHGLVFDGGMWKHQVPEVATFARTLVFDGPGHGKSTELPPPFSIEDHADALMDAFDDRGIDRAIIVGLSWGGMLGMRAALQHPSRIAALALFDTSADAEPVPNRIKYRAMAMFARRFGLPRWMVERRIAPILYGATTMRERGPEVTDEMVRRVNGYARNAMARAVKAVVVKRTSVVDRIANIRVPTLVVCGREDVATPPARAEEIARRIQGSRLVLIERAGHSAPLERPREVNAELVPWLREQLRSAAARDTARI